MHLRFLTRLQAVAAIFIFGLIAYSTWIYPSLSVRTRLSKVLKGSQTKLVVFGDSFSDTGSHFGDVKASFQRDDAEGQRWTEVLCKEVRIIPSACIES